MSIGEIPLGDGVIRVVGGELLSFRSPFDMLMAYSETDAVAKPAL